MTILTALAADVIPQHHTVITYSDVSADAYTLSEAASYCEGMGSELLELNNVEEAYFVASTTCAYTFCICNLFVFFTPSAHRRENLSQQHVTNEVK